MTEIPSKEKPMLSTSAFAETAALLGDLARANMMAALMDGRALTAAELARFAGITPQTASGHLALLTDAGLLAMERQGRHRYHRLASPAIARMIEGIMSVASDLEGPGRSGRKRPVVTGPRDQALRHARTCYDHLAGEVAVAITDRMAERGQIEFTADGGALTRDGTRFLNDLGVDLGVAPSGAGGRDSGRMFCRPCLDWSERRPHIAGVVGKALCQCCFERGWIRRMDNTRAINITPAGYAMLSKDFDYSA
jgi:DNA-binding transcriptional ArsR family regulator